MKALVVDDRTGGAVPMNLNVTATDAEIRINLDGLIIAVAREDMEMLLGIDDGK